MHVSLPYACLSVCVTHLCVCSVCFTCTQIADVEEIDLLVVGSVGRKGPKMYAKKFTHILVNAIGQITCAQKNNCWIRVRVRANNTC